MHAIQAEWPLWPDWFMQTANYRRIILVLLMFTFIGQVVASTSESCRSLSAPSSEHQLTMEYSEMDHSRHMGSNTMACGGATDTDCPPDCSCSMGGCSSLAIPIHQSTFSAGLKSQFGRYDESVDLHLTASLFRPPISR